MASRKNNLSNSGWFFWPLAALLVRCRSLRICASHAPCQRPKFLRPSCIILFFRDAYPLRSVSHMAMGLSTGFFAFLSNASVTDGRDASPSRAQVVFAGAVTSARRPYPSLGRRH
jgi:hypothetical protein